MRLDVLIAQNDDQVERKILLLRCDSDDKEIMKKKQNLNWNHMGITNLNDRLLASSGPISEAEIRVNGHALLSFMT